MTRNHLLLSAFILLATSPILSHADPATPEDPYLWLEEVEGERALEWVEQQNQKSLAELEALPPFQKLFERNLEVYDSNERIPYPSIRGKYLYNFWKDANHVRGIWRRTTLDGYSQEDIPWETVIDLDQLAEAEGENWVWKGASCLRPEQRHCMINLSRGGADAVVRREFDTEQRSFVEDGFKTTESKGGVAWKDANTLLVAVDFGEGSMTNSGYPRQIKVWQRGTDLADAELFFETVPEDVGAWPVAWYTPEGTWVGAAQVPDTFRQNYFFMVDGELRQLDIPPDAVVNAVFQGQAIVSLKSDWTPDDTTLAQGSVVSMDLKQALGGEARPEVLLKPDPRGAVQSIASTRNQLLVNRLVDVRSRLDAISRIDGAWQHHSIDAPAMGSISITTTSDEDDGYFFTYTDFLTPTTLFRGMAQQAPESGRQLPAFFDAENLAVSQHFVDTADGARVPYFQVARKDLELDGDNPTLIYAYGGFEVSQDPNYSATVGIDWLSQGGTFVVANIRGGGEYGPAWHQAALKENRQRAYDDFIAVAEDLIERGVTSPRRLGIRGGSNGGLLTGVLLTQRPDLWGAVVSQVPLLDMRRYHLLLAGASWMGEYGDPDDPAQWEFIKTFSPYHLLDAKADYPPVLITTSTRDDRVHPGHARKMVARMQEQGHEVTYYENTEGGHAGASNNRQSARMQALTYTFLLNELGLVQAEDSAAP